MDINITDYRNPIFGILVLILIILFITCLDSIKKSHARKKRKEALNNISKNFENINLSQSLKSFIEYAENPLPTLSIIADTYTKSGDNEQAIAIWRALNEYARNPKEKIETLQALGECYYNAGFLERSKEIFLEILRNYPHNLKILQNYMHTCENLKQYNEALDALKCIESIYKQNDNLGYNVNIIFHTKNYLKTMNIITNHKMKLLEQQDKLLEIYKLDSTLHGIILRHFKIYNTGLFWQHILQKRNVSQYIDILWQFQKHEIPFEYIEPNHAISDVYRAKGYISKYAQIDNFALESLQLLNLYSHIKGTLDFFYQCKICNASTPFYVYRCPHCSNIDSIILIFKPSEYKVELDIF